MFMKAKLQLAFAAAILCAALLPQDAHAYRMTSGGMFDKINGTYYGVRPNRSGVGKKNYVKKKYKAKTYTKKKYKKNYASGYGGYNAGPRPKRWCGWWMRTQKGGGPKFNVAWNWRHYGRPSGPQVGAVVVWRHHVGMIVGRASDGRWIVKSGNDSNRVRTRARSVKGAVFRI